MNFQQTSIFDPAPDGDPLPHPEIRRLNTLTDYIRDIMLDGLARTPEKIQAELARDYDRKAGTACITARLRDLRKEKFGGYRVEKSRRGDRGAWEYKVSEG